MTENKKKKRKLYAVVSCVLYFISAFKYQSSDSKSVLYKGSGEGSHPLVAAICVITIGRD